MNNKDIEDAKKAMNNFKNSGMDNRSLKKIQDSTKSIQPILDEFRKNNKNFKIAYKVNDNPEIQRLQKQIKQIQNSGDPFSRKKLNKMINEFGLPGNPTINFLYKINSLQEKPNKNSKRSNDNGLNSKNSNEDKNSTYEASTENDRNDYGNNSDNPNGFTKNKSFRYIKSDHYKCSDWIFSKKSLDNFDLVAVPFSTFNTNFDFFSKKFDSNTSPEIQAEFWKNQLNKIKNQSDNFDIFNKAFELAKNIAWVIAVIYYLISHIF